MDDWISCDPAPDSSIFPVPGGPRFAFPVDRPFLPVSHFWRFVSMVARLRLRSSQVDPLDGLEFIMFETEACRPQPSSLRPYDLEFFPLVLARIFRTGEYWRSAAPSLRSLNGDERLHLGMDAPDFRFSYSPFLFLALQGNFDRALHPSVVQTNHNT